MHCLHSGRWCSAGVAGTLAVSSARPCELYLSVCCLLLMLGFICSAQLQGTSGMLIPLSPPNHYRAACAVSGRQQRPTGRLTCLHVLKHAFIAGRLPH